MALKEFIATIAKRDVARQNRFATEIFPPAGTGPAGRYGLSANRQVNMLCESVTFPGQNIRTASDDLRSGPSREIGQGVTYGDITLSFICTPGLPEKRFFEIWQSLMFNSVTWQAKFYNEYIGEIKLYQLDREDVPRYGIRIYEAYPKIITGQDYSYANSDSYQTLSIEFALHHWTPLSDNDLKNSALAVGAERTAALQPPPDGHGKDLFDSTIPPQLQRPRPPAQNPAEITGNLPTDTSRTAPGTLSTGSELSRGREARPPEDGSKTPPDADQARLAASEFGFPDYRPPSENPAEDPKGKPPEFASHTNRPFVADAGDMSGVRPAPAPNKEGGPESGGDHHPPYPRGDAHKKHPAANPHSEPPTGR